MYRVVNFKECPRGDIWNRANTTHPNHQHFNSASAGNMFTPRGEMGFVDFRSREELNVRRADVKHRPFVQPLYRTSKDVDPRQIVSLNERHQNGFQRPEFTSLADVYEGALRNVLDIQLHLTLDDQQSFTQNAINDLLFRDKSSPGQHRAPLRQEPLKRRSENHQHERPTEESKDLNNSGSFQGRTLLRDPRRVSPGGSAFHVPPKKARMEEEMQYSERGFPMDRYGVPPSGNGFPPDYPSSFPSPRGSPGMYHRRVTGPEAAAHVYGTNGIHIPVPRDRYSLWSFGHHRDATLFPMRCSSVESERRFHRGLLEEEKQRSMDFARLNGFAHEKPAVRVKIEKETKEEGLKGDQKPSPTERQSSLSPGKETGLEKRAEREKLSPSSSPKFSKPNTLLPTYRSSPINGTGAVDFRMKTRYRSALRKIESRREGKKGSGEDAKDEFLFKLGLERIEA